MKATKRDWLHFTAGAVTATIIISAFLNAAKVSAQETSPQLVTMSIKSDK
jgi:hypothetical protein